MGVRTEFCELCNQEVEYMVEEPLTSVEAVAVVQLDTFLSKATYLPVSAGPYLWKRRQWVEKCICDGGFYVPQYSCGSTFLVKNLCTDARDAPFWFSIKKRSSRKK